MTEEKRDKKLRDRDVMFRRWRAWHREEIEALRLGAWGEDVEELLALLDKLGPNDGEKLLDLVRAQNWRAASECHRYLILREVDLAIARVREGLDLPPCDDAMPWSSEPYTTFQLVREYLFDDDEPAAASS